MRVRRADCVCAAARIHPRHSVCTRPCAARRASVCVRVLRVCVARGARAAPQRPWASSILPRAPPHFSALLSSHAQYLPPLSPLPQLLSLSFSAALFPSPSLSLSFAPSATQSAMDSRRVRNWLTVNVEFLGYVGERVRYVCYRSRVLSRDGFVRFGFRSNVA